MKRTIATILTLASFLPTYASNITELERQNQTYANQIVENNHQPYRLDRENKQGRETIKTNFSLKNNTIEAKIQFAESRGWLSARTYTLDIKDLPNENQQYGEINRIVIGLKDTRDAGRKIVDRHTLTRLPESIREEVTELYNKVLEWAITQQPINPKEFQCLPQIYDKLVSEE